MAASSPTTQLSSMLLSTTPGTSGTVILSSAPVRLRWRDGFAQAHAGLAAMESRSHRLGAHSRASSRGRFHVVGARRPARDGNGRVAEAVEPIPEEEDAEPDDMFMGRKLEGLEPDFWEGEQWDTLGFLVQYMWAFGFLVALVGCGVAVATYNLGATDIRDTEVFKEALDNQVEDDSPFDYDNSQDFPTPTEAPSLD